jgi:hypothetical protein
VPLVDEGGAVLSFDHEMFDKLTISPSGQWIRVGMFGKKQSLVGAKCEVHVGGSRKVSLGAHAGDDRHITLVVDGPECSLVLVVKSVKATRGVMHVSGDRKAMKMERKAREFAQRINQIGLAEPT